VENVWTGNLLQGTYQRVYHVNAADYQYAARQHYHSGRLVDYLSHVNTYGRSNWQREELLQTQFLKKLTLEDLL